MSRFLILFNAPEPMSQFMTRSTPEERQAGLNAWSVWKAEAEKTLKLEFGAVVQAVSHIQKGEVTKSANQASNYAFAEAETLDDVTKAFQNHPHLGRNSASIDVLEVLPMPGQ